MSPSQGLYLHRTTQHRKTRTNIHALSWIRTHDFSNQQAKTHASDRTATVTGTISLWAMKNRSIGLFRQPKFYSLTLTYLNRRPNCNLLCVLSQIYRLRSRAPPPPRAFDYVKYFPQFSPQYMNIRFKHCFLYSLLIQLFIWNLLLIERRKFREPWLCFTNWSNNAMYSLRYMSKYMCWLVIIF
jgi:hypothetical protein